MRNIIPTATAALLAASAPAAIAQNDGELLIAESFEIGDGGYDPGTIATQSPEIFGFAADMRWGGSKGASFKLLEEGLDFPGISARGGALEIRSGAGFKQVSRGSVDGLIADGPERLWFGALFRRDEGEDRLLMVNFARSSEKGPLQFGLDGPAVAARVQTRGGNNRNLLEGEPYELGDTQWLVLRVDVDPASGDNDDWHLFRNPDASAEPDASEAVLSGTGALFSAPLEIASIQPRVSSSKRAEGEQVAVVDEIRVATGYAALVAGPDDAEEAFAPVEPG